MKYYIIFSVLLITSNVFSQEKKLLLRFNSTCKFKLDVQKKKYLKGDTIKFLGTVLVYSKKVMIHNEKKDTFESYEIMKTRKDGKRMLYIAKNRDYVFALTENKKYFTQIGRKNRIIYNIINFKYADE